MIEPPGVVAPGGATPDARAQSFSFGPLHRPNPGGAEKTGFQPVNLIRAISYNFSEAPEDRLGSTPPRSSSWSPAPPSSVRPTTP